MRKKSILLALLTASVLASGTAGWAKDNLRLGAATVQSLLQANPSLSAEDATVQALQTLRKKKTARAGAAEEGLREVWRRSPENLKAAALKIMEADTKTAGYVVRMAGQLDRTVNQEILVAAVRTNPEQLGFSMREACNNDPARSRELALAADAALPGHSLDILGGVMASSCSLSRALCWHYRELEKRAAIDIAGVLDEAVSWEAEAAQLSLRGTTAQLTGRH
jgi:hypothetical protein